MLVTLWVFSNLATQWKGTTSAQQHMAAKLNIWVRMCQNHRLIKEVAGTHLTILGNSQFHRVSWKIAHWQSRTFLHVYSDVFTGIGKFPGMPYKFQLKENVKPARHAPRKVPIHLQDAFHREIRNLEKLGILEETKDVTEWVNSFVIMEKKTPDVSNSQSDRKFQICLDPRDLNEALEREPYYTWSIEEIMTRFHGMTRFTIADFNKGYWMVELNPESWKYTMMALDIGRFQWTKATNGINCCSGHVSKETRCYFPWYTRCHRYCWRHGGYMEKTDLEHDRHLINFLNICRKKHSYAKSRQNAIQVTTGFILWTSVECQGAQSRSKEGCSSQEDGFAWRCWKQCKVF